jgi:hypothetical protein
LTENSSDNARPSCSFCQGIGAQCDYGTRDASSFDQASLTILDRLSVIESLVRQIPRSGASPDSQQNLESTLQLPAELDQLASHCSPLSKPATWRLNLDANYKVGIDSILQWPIFERPLAQLRRLLFVDSQNNETFTFLDDLFNGSDASSDQLMKQYLRDSPISINISTDRSDIEPLVARFFKRVHVKNPVLDPLTINKYCQAYYEHGPLFNLETCLVLIICALGAVATEFGPREDLDLPQQPARLEALRLGSCYFAAAEKRIGAATIQSSTLAVQCLCLAGCVIPQ